MASAQIFPCAASACRLRRLHIEAESLDSTRFSAGRHLPLLQSLCIEGASGGQGYQKLDIDVMGCPHLSQLAIGKIEVQQPLSVSDLAQSTSLLRLQRDSDRHSYSACELEVFSLCCGGVQFDLMQGHTPGAADLVPQHVNAIYWMVRTVQAIHWVRTLEQVRSHLCSPAAGQRVSCRADMPMPGTLHALHTLLLIRQHVTSLVLLQVHKCYGKHHHCEKARHGDDGNLALAIVPGSHIRHGRLYCSY